MSQKREVALPCPKCGDESTARSPTLRLGEERGAPIQCLVGPINRGRAARNLRKPVQTALHPPAGTTVSTRPPIATTLDSPAKKAAIAREGLDGRATELLKAPLFLGLGEGFFHAEGKDRHFELFSKERHLTRFGLTERFHDTIAGHIAGNPGCKADNEPFADAKWTLKIAREIPPGA